MNKNTITCKKCGSEIEISEALTHQIEDEVFTSLEAKHKEELDQAVKVAEERVVSRVRGDFQISLDNAQKEIQEEKKRSVDLIDQLKLLNEEIRALRRKDEERDLEMGKRLAESEDKIRNEASRKAKEEANGEILELKKQAEDTKKALEVANYKLSQKSQQLQGEVFEIDLEKTLREAFVDDEIVPVAKGKAGGDIVQKVKGKSGRVAGAILWETKRAKWKAEWVSKLREDARSEGASVSVLVCTDLPKEIENFQISGGVIVTSDIYAIPLAGVLRRSILQTAIAKQTAMNKDENLEFLYQYLQSEAFRHRFEAFAEGVKQMQEDLNYERSGMERIWKKREIQIQKMLLNASRMYGELQGVMGDALPEIKVFSLPEVTDDESPQDA